MPLSHSQHPSGARVPRTIIIIRSLNTALYMPSTCPVTMHQNVTDVTSGNIGNAKPVTRALHYKNTVLWSKQTKRLLGTAHNAWNLLYYHCIIIVLSLHFHCIFIVLSL